MYIHHNGKWVNDGHLIVGAQSRALRYGDGLFETIRCSKGKVLMPQLHMARLFGGMQLLGFQPPSYFNEDYIIKQIENLVLKNHHLQGARVRLMVYRGNGGVFDPDNDFPNLLIESVPLTHFQYPFNENGLLIGLYPEARKACDRFSNLKSNNYLPYLAAARYAKQLGWNDALILNARDRIADSCIANLFIVKANKIITPPLSEGPVAGTIRQWLIHKEQINGLPVVEAPIEPDQLLAADEVFLTNAIYGIRWVAHCGERSYRSAIAASIYRELLQTIP